MYRLFLNIHATVLRARKLEHGRVGVWVKIKFCKTEHGGHFSDVRILNGVAKDRVPVSQFGPGKTFGNRGMNSKVSKVFHRDAGPCRRQCFPLDTTVWNRVSHPVEHFRHLVESMPRWIKFVLWGKKGMQLNIREVFLSVSMTQIPTAVCVVC
jgi:hypothetical protein